MHNEKQPFSLGIYIIHLLICTLLLFILSRIYVTHGNSISNRVQLSKVLVIVGITTFIIISIVKSSLALSLGLVGALSIIRFRTAIKEPEELGYFFISIAIGLGLGANQVYPTLVGFILLSIVILALSKGRQKNITQNLLIIYSINKETNQEVLVRNTYKIISRHCNRIDLKRFHINDENLNINLRIDLNSLESITMINTELKSINKKSIDITYIDNQL